jgi:intracellular sulfur oxidation DsrE/DsrF family protein
MTSKSNVTSIPNQAAAAIAVEPPNVTFRHDLTIVAETAARLLVETSASERPRVVARLLDAGADAELTYRSNLTVQLFERRIDGLGASLAGELDSVMKAGGRDVEERLLKAMHKFEKDLVEWTTRYLDPRSPDGLPAVAATRLRQTTDAALAHVRLLLTEEPGGPLDRLSEKLIAQVQATERNLVAQLAQRNAARQLGSQKGRTFEECLTGKLSQVAVAMGCQVERCGDSLGAKRMRHGDLLMTFTDTPVTVRVVIEAKSRGDGQRLSFEAVGKECRNARANREASAAVLVADSREALPDGVAFGQVGRADFFVEFDHSSGDDLGLIAALYLARAAALQREVTGSSQVDRDTARTLVKDIRERVERRTRVRGLHASAVKAINGATKAFDEDTESVLANLARLDAVLLA